MNLNHKRTPFAEVLNHLDRKYSNFDGSGYQEPYYDYIEGAPEEVNNTTKVFQADPYQIIIENPDKVAHKAILFGNDKFLLKNNFGSDPEIKITMGQPGVEYVELLQSSQNPFLTQFMRIESENKLQISKFITVNQKNANGNWFQRPMNMQQYKSAYQNQENMLDAPINEEIKGSTYWEIEIEPLTRVFYTIFPLYKVDTSEPLRGNEAIKTFAPARVNTAGQLILPQQNLLPRR
ncbi:hypothetical protein D3C71_887300 [compost metagenome]